MWRRWAWLILPVAFFAMCCGWALTSPVGSSPDDDYHLASIWCAGGEALGTCETVPGHPEQRAVPARVVNAAACFAFHPEVSGNCAAGLASGVVATDRVNITQNLYPGGYYRAMRVFVGADVERSVLTMRLVNAALAAALLLLLLRVTTKGISSAAVLTLVATFVPLGLFLVASTNPSGWAVVGLTMYLGFALALLFRNDWRSRRSWLIGAGAVVCGLMAVTSRLDSAVFVILASVIVAIAAGPRRLRTAWPATIVLLAVSVLGAWTYVSHDAPSFADPSSGVGGAEQGVGLLLTNAVYLPILLAQAVGFGGLGWNDTALPPLVGVVGVLVLGALAYAGLEQITRRKGWAATLALVALVGVPSTVLYRDGLAVGEAVQPRYLLPLMAILVFVLCLGPRPGRPIVLARAPVAVLSVGLSASAVLAYWTNAHRYFAGTATGLFDLKIDPSWLSATGVPLWLTTLVTATASVVFVTGALVTVRDSARRG